MLTIADLNAMTERDEWLGYGYLGSRQNVLTSDDPEAPANPDLVAEADMKAVDNANEYGLTIDQLFDWANSKYGRWYGDCMFGNAGRHADDYTPAAFIADVPED